MKERQEQFECDYCDAKFNFRKDAEDHEQQCSAKRTDKGHVEGEGAN